MKGIADSPAVDCIRACPSSPTKCAGGGPRPDGEEGAGGARPDDWSQALFSLELIARAARDVGDHDGDRRAAAAAMALAEKYWKDADPDLTELRDVRDWLRRHPE